MTVSWRVSVCPSGTGLGMYIYENIYLYWIYAATYPKICHKKLVVTPKHVWIIFASAHNNSCPCATAFQVVFYIYFYVHDLFPASPIHSFCPLSLIFPAMFSHMVIILTIILFKCARQVPQSIFALWLKLSCVSFQ